MFCGRAFDPVCIIPREVGAGLGCTFFLASSATLCPTSFLVCPTPSEITGSQTLFNINSRQESSMECGAAAVLPQKHRTSRAAYTKGTGNLQVTHSSLLPTFYTRSAPTTRKAVRSAAQEEAPVGTELSGNRMQCRPTSVALRQEQSHRFR